jgi:uncharacterized membrane protein YhaH (DUF805 family)
MSFKTLYFSPTGRLSRSKYFTAPIILGIVIGLIQFLMGIVMAPLALIMLPVLGIAYLVSFFMINIKRWHDLDKSGWLSLLLFIPIVNFFVGIYLLFAKGAEGDNQYGSSPEKASTVALVACIILIVLSSLTVVVAGGLGAYYGGQAFNAGIANGTIQMEYSE